MVLGGTICVFGADDKKAVSADSAQIVKHLDPVVVYSQRRSEDLRSVPASVSAFSPAKIERENIVSVKDITLRIPNFYMPDYGNKVNSQIYIRGIGSKFTTPSVAFYVDYVPYFEKSTFDYELFDIKSIEVFRGPQGSLFGRNAIGGVISIFSKEPSETMRNTLVASYGERNFMNFKFSHSKSYGKFGVSASASYTKRDGFFTNTYDNSKVDNVEQFNSRIALTYKATPTFDIKLIGSFGFNNDGGNPYNVYDTTSYKFKDVSYNHKSYYTRNVVNGALVLSKKIGDFELRNVSSYQYFQDHQHLDQDYTAEDLYVSNFYQYQNLATNELVFLTPKAWKWESVTGVFAFKQWFDKGIKIENGKDVYRYIGTRNVSETKNIPDATNHTQTGDRSEGLAFFHSSQVKDILTEGLNVSIGARLDFEKKSFDYTNATTLPNPIVIPTPNGNISIPLPPSMPNPIVVSRDYSTDKLVFLPKATISYNLSEQNVYASWSVGYKSGGFNTSFDQSKPESIAYDPEYAENVEVGVKTQWLDSRLRINASAFYIDWRNQQINVFLTSGQGLMVTNAGHSFSKGFELEMSAIPVTNLQVYGSYGYVVAKYLDYKESATVSYDGNYIPLVPRSTFDAGATYRLPFGDGESSLLFGLDFQRVGKHYWNDANGFALFKNSPAYQNAWFNLNSVVGYSYKSIDVNVRVKNITNERYNTYMFEYEVEKFQRLYAQKNRPRMVFVELSYRF